MREKLKPFSVLIVGTLAITAFVRGSALDIVLGVFWGLFIVYSVVKRIVNKRNPKSKPSKAIVEYRGNSIIKLAMMLKSKGGMLSAISKIIR